MMMMMMNHREVTVAASLQVQGQAEAAAVVHRWGHRAAAAAAQRADIHVNIVGNLARPDLACGAT